MSAHRCSRVVDGHPIRQLLSLEAVRARDPRTARHIGAHGYCEACHGPVVQCKLGRFHHVGAVEL